MDVPGGWVGLPDGFMAFVFTGGPHWTAWTQRSYADTPASGHTYPARRQLTAAPPCDWLSRVTAASWLPVVPALFGLTVGSFLNVVIFRLPRELSVLRPRWSFCTACQSPIAALDNIPVLSWLLLRGRCRQCRLPIAPRYPVIELLTAIVFVAAYDALSAAPGPFAAERGAAGLIVLIGHLVLYASLLANAVMDADEYLVDLRVAHAATLAGIVMHAARGAVTTPALPAAAESHPAFGIAALAGLLVGLLLFWRASRRAWRDDHAAAGAACGDPDDALGVESEQLPSDDAGALSATDAQPAPSHAAFVWVAVLALTLVALITCIVLARSAPGAASQSSLWWRAAAVVGLMTLILVRSMLTERPVDEEIVDALEVERGSARAQSLRELLLVLPGAAVAVLVLWLLKWPAAAPDWNEAFGAELHSILRATAGAQTALVGLAAATAFGWAVRIFFTLVFGREAFGTGDIHLMAAIGAVGGFWTCVVAFFAAGLLGLVGVLAAQFKRSVHALPFGPWLALGALAALWAAPPLYELVAVPLEELSLRLIETFTG